MKKTISIITFTIISSYVFAQQWVLDEIADEQRDTGSSPVDGILGMLLFFGIIWILGNIADKWKDAKDKGKKYRIKVEREKKEKKELEKKEKVLRTNAIPSPMDLGLSVKWADFNIGAYKSNDFGDTFYWAENSPSKCGSPKHYKKNTNHIGNISGNKDYDAAANIYGDKWRLPTDDELKELIEKCKWQADIIEGTEGYTVIGPNGNSIFLPFTDKNYGDSEFSYSHYWSSCPSFRRDLHESAQSLRIEKGTNAIELVHGSSAARCLFSIRPVYGDLASDEETKSKSLFVFSCLKEAIVDDLSQLYKKYEEQSYIKDEEKKDSTILGIFYDESKTFTDEYGVVYSIDGKRLLDAGNCTANNYIIREGTEILCNNAFGKTFFQERNNRIELGKIIVPSSVCYISPSALPNTCTVECYSPYYNVVDELLVDKRKLSVVKCLNKFKQKAFVGVPIVSIESYAFSHCDALRNVSLPDSLVYIKEFAFFNCPMLEEVNLPNSLKDIEDSAFANCEMLTIKSLPISIRNIGNNAFYRCNRFEGVIPIEIDTLGITPFPKKECYLKSLSSNYSITNGLLINNSKCSVIQSLQPIKELEIPDNIIEIEDHAFSWTDLETVIIPSNIKSIGVSAFSCCDYLLHFEFNNNIKLISTGMFSWCKKLKEIIIPDGIERIDDYAFKNCIELCKIVLPESLISIGIQAFAECHSLESIIIPLNVKSIGQVPQYFRVHDAFNNCKNLRKVVLNARHLDLFELPNSVQIRVIGDQVETLPSYFFSGYESAKIEIPNSIKTIKKESLRSCKFLSELSFYCEDVELEKDWLVTCRNIKTIKIVKESFDNIYNKLPVMEGVKYKKIYKHDWWIVRW